MVRKVFRVGHSVCVTLDKKMLREIGLDGISFVWVEPDKKGKKITIRKRTEQDW